MKLEMEKLKVKKHKISFFPLRENREKDVISLFPCSKIGKKKT
jgi:hypothetical protein